MSYKLKCRSCGNVFTSTRRNADCPAFLCGSDNHSVLEDIAEVAVGLAVGYVTGSLIESVAESAIDVVGGLFDW